MSNQLEKIKELIDRRAAARLGGGEKAIAKHWLRMLVCRLWRFYISAFCFFTLVF